MTETIEIQLKKGVLGLCVLALLNRADSYAYEIASRLSDAIDMGEGTIYPLMRRMQSDGQVETYLVESSSGPSNLPTGAETTNDALDEDLSSIDAQLSGLDADTANADQSFADQQVVQSEL